MKREDTHPVEHACPLCNGAQTRTLFEVASQPVLIGVQWEDEKSARASQTGDVRLAFCRTCGFIWNVLFDPARLEYQQTYENSLHFSKVFQDYTRELVDRLVGTYGVRGKRVVDIGCGKGDFLAMLCEAGNNYGFGFDPTYEGVRIETSARDRIQWLRENYSAKHAALQADLITSRYVFEHIPAPVPFLEMIRRSIVDPMRTIVYFEVPNADLILRQQSVWDIIYEHCTYFSFESLPRAFERAGFEVLSVDEPYGKQFLSVEARVRTQKGSADGAWGDLADLDAAVDTFATVAPTRLETWREKLAAWHAEGKRVVVWGAGAKAVGFLNMLGVGAEIGNVVDINPHKHGKYLSGTGHRVVSPDSLTGNRPDVVILMNPVYRDEVAAQLAAMHLHPQLVNV